MTYCGPSGMRPMPNRETIMIVGHNVVGSEMDIHRPTHIELPRHDIGN